MSDASHLKVIQKLSRSQHSKIILKSCCISTNTTHKSYKFDKIWALRSEIGQRSKIMLRTSENISTNYSDKQTDRRRFSLASISYTWSITIQCLKLMPSFKSHACFEVSTWFNQKLVSYWSTIFACWQDEKTTFKRKTFLV